MDETLVVPEGSAGSVVTVLDKVDDPVNFGLTHAVFYFFCLIFIFNLLIAEKKGTWGERNAS